MERETELMSHIEDFCRKWKREEVPAPQLLGLGISDSSDEFHPMNKTRQNILYLWSVNV